MRDRLVQEAVLCIAGDDSGALASSSQQTLARGEIELRNVRFAVVAAKAFLLENGLDILREVRPACRIGFLRLKQARCQDRRGKDDDKTARDGIGESFGRALAVANKLEAAVS